VVSIAAVGGLILGAVVVAMLVAAIPGSRVALRTVASQLRVP
jgi:hypothetical protein